MARRKALDLANELDDELYHPKDAARVHIVGSCRGDERRETVAWTARGAWRYSGANYADLGWDHLTFGYSTSSSVSYVDFGGYFQADFQPAELDNCTHVATSFFDDVQEDAPRSYFVDGIISLL